MTKEQEQLLQTLSTMSEALTLQTKLQLKQQQELKRIGDVQQSIAESLQLIAISLQANAQADQRRSDQIPADAAEYRDEKHDE